MINISGFQINTVVGPDTLVLQAAAEVCHYPALQGLLAIGLLLLALQVDPQEIRNGHLFVSKVFLAPSFITGLDYSFICQLFK